MNNPILKIEKPINRRLFLGASVAIPMFGLFSKMMGALDFFQTDFFKTEYTVNLAPTVPDGKIKDQISVDNLTHNVLNNFGADKGWQAKYYETTEKYKADGRLVHAYRLISPDRTQVTFVKIWKNKAIFKNFYAEAQVHRLDDAFINAGLNPKLADVKSVFSKDTV